MKEVNYESSCFSRVLSVTRARIFVIVDSSSFHALVVPPPKQIIALSRFLNQNVLESGLKPGHRAVQNVGLCIKLSLTDMIALP